MFIAEMETGLHIVLISDAKSGLAEIMSGYLNFYGTPLMVISLRVASPTIHPLAEQVLKEDGIDIWKTEKVIPKNTKKLTIYINQAQQQHQKTAASKYYNFEDPLSFDSYDKIVAAFRKTRESIKKASIELVGEITVGL